MGHSGRRNLRVALGLGIMLAGTVLVAPSVQAVTAGDLTQRAQCFSADTDGCSYRPEMSFPGSMAVSPDGRNVYLAGGTGVTVFTRSASGALSPLAAPNGCLAASGDGVGCTAVRAMSDAREIVVSRDGKNVYVGTLNSPAIIAFARNTTTGVLTQLAGADGCYTASTTVGCTTVTALSAVNALAVTPDGTSLFSSGDGLVVFGRAASGALTFSTCLSSSDGCGTVPDLAYAMGIAVSPDSRSVYVAERSADTLFVLDRDLVTRQLTVSACLGFAAGCTAARGMDGVKAVAVSPDGKSVYTGAADHLFETSTHGVVGVFNRSRTLGSTYGDLTQKAGTAGCLSVDGVDVVGGQDGQCGKVRGAGDAEDVVVSPDGINVYVAGQSSSSLAVLRRASGGGLTQGSGAAGCVSNDGSQNCTDGQRILAPWRLALSPKPGANLYVSSGGSSTSLTIFNRHLYPNTTITRGPSGETTDHTPTFRFTSTDPHSTFRCRVDDSRFVSCSSPFTTRRLAKGKHKFAVKATNPAGYVDPTPAVRRFRVVAG
jgi:DNA-binding beta-propeller fold protein YncE